MASRHYTVLDSFEKWALSPVFPGAYEVSDRGRVRRSLNRGPGKSGFILKQFTDKGGYRRVTIKYGKLHRQIGVHQLVSYAFCGAYFEGCQVRHLDGLRDHNDARNLKTGTSLENAEDCILHGNRPHGSSHVLAKLDEEKAVQILGMRKRGMMLKDIAATFGVALSTVGGVCYRATWTHVLDQGDRK